MTHGSLKCVVLILLSEDVHNDIKSGMTVSLHPYLGCFLFLKSEYFRIHEIESRIQIQCGWEQLTLINKFNRFIKPFSNGVTNRLFFKSFNSEHRLAIGYKTPKTADAKFASAWLPCRMV